MKKKIARIFLLILCVFIITPANVQAETFNPADTAVSVDIDENSWYVFTRENVTNNEDLAYLGIDSQYMLQRMETENSYINAIMYFGDYNNYLEMLVKKTDNEEVNNLNNYDRKGVLEIASAMSEKNGISDYVVCEDFNDKYILFTYEKDNLYCQEYVTVINGENYSFVLQKTSPFEEQDKETIKNTLNTVSYTIDPSKTKENKKDDNNESGLSLTTVMIALIVVAAVGFGIYGFINRKNKVNLHEKMNEFYETISFNSRSAVFSDRKKEFYFVGNMLYKLFPNWDLKDLFIKYVNLHKTYTNSDSNVFESFEYVKENYKEFSEEEQFTLLSLVMLNVDGIKRYDDCNLERIEPFRKKAKATIKCVETIDANKDIFATNANDMIGTRENPILLSGINGIKHYLSSIIAEDGTKLEYIHKSIVYIKDKKLDISYDLRKYTLKDATTGVEIRDIWFNSYGIGAYKQCIDGFVFKNEIDENYFELMKAHAGDDSYSIVAPANIKVSNVASSGKPKIVWDAVDTANKYFVYRSPSKNGIYTYLGSTANTNYTNTTAEPGVCYYYRVKAADTVSKYVVSEFSKIYGSVCDLEQPTIDISLKEGKPVVKWDAIPGASKYELYRKIEEDGTFEKYFITVNTSVTNVSTEAGKTYYYKVVAVCPLSSQGNSAYSNEVHITAEK